MDTCDSGDLGSKTFRFIRTFKVFGTSRVGTKHFLMLAASRSGARMSDAQHCMEMKKYNAQCGLREDYGQVRGQAYIHEINCFAMEVFSDIVVCEIY